MRIQLLTWDAHDINDGVSFTARSPVGSSNGMSAATPNYIDMGAGDPVLGGKTLSGTLYTFQVQLLGETDAEMEDDRDLLNSWFLPNDFTKRQLIGVDVDSIGETQWYLEGFTVSPPVLVPDARGLYSITLALTSPYWIEVVENTNTWTVEEDASTNDLTNNGNIPARPKFQITPRIPKSLIAYNTFCAVYTNGWAQRKGIPVDITPDGVDTAALILLGKMQADGSDVRVVINGTSRDFWFGGGGINTSTTHIWTWVSFTASYTLSLVTAMNGTTTPASITASYDYATIAFPSNSTLLLGTEFVAYTSVVVDTNNKTVTFSGLTRAAKGSTISAHLASVDVMWIENDIWIYYGNTSSVAPAAGVTAEPVIDLETSTNSQWEYVVFNKPFTPPPSGGVGPFIVTPPYNFAPSRFGKGYAYTSEHDDLAVFDVVAGLKLYTWLNGSVVVSSSQAGWSFSHPGGISEISATGEKYRSGANFGTVTIDVFSNSLYTAFHTEAAPSVVATWEPITISALDLSAINPTAFVFKITGSLGTTLPLPYAMAELNAVTLVVADPPTVYIPDPEQESYLLDGTITNNTTGEIIVMSNILAKTDETTTIDCDTLEVYSQDGKRLRGMVSFDGPKRDEWMTLASGVNEIEFSDTGTLDVDIVTTWRARNTI